MKLFANHFRTEVIPRLHHMIQVEAECCRLKAVQPSASYDYVMHQACELGALHLNDALFHELEDWLATTLRIEIERAGLDGGA